MHIVESSSRERLTQGNFSLIMLGVVFVLFLIAFVTVPMHSNMRHLEIASSKNADPFIAEGGINVAITDDGYFVVNGTWVPAEKFDSCLSKLLGERPGKAVSLAGDSRLKYSTVREMTRRLSRLGVDRLYLVTEGNKMKVLSAAWRSEAND